MTRRSSDAILSSASTARAERQPLLSGAPPPQVFAHPIECASLTSRLLLQWVTPSVTLANCPPTQTPYQTPRGSTKRGLQQKDVWELPPSARAEPGANALQRQWISSGSLSLALAKAHGLKFAGLGLLYAVVQICDLLGPYVLFRGVVLIQGQEDQDEEETRNSLLFWLGTLLFSRLSLVFQKALRLSNASVQEADTLYGADVTQLLQGISCLHELWAAPLMLSLILTLIE
ncbi:Multidrug resistance protein ABC Superfamily, partial [Phytophthora palmivora]